MALRRESEGGRWDLADHQATWVGRYMVDGYMIADEYRMVDRAGELVVHGINLRSYSVGKKSWIMRWLDATRSLWAELGPEELGGVRVNPETITFNLIDQFAPGAISRVTFSNISTNHFTWSEAKSLDEGRTWTEFVAIEAQRTR